VCKDPRATSAVLRVNLACRETLEFREIVGLRDPRVMLE
jgi:hypothetical protein